MLPLLRILFKGHEASPDSMWEDTTQQREYQEAGLLGVIFGCCCPTKKKQNHDLTFDYRPSKVTGLAQILKCGCHAFAHTDLFSQDIQTPGYSPSHTEHLHTYPDLHTDVLKNSHSHAHLHTDTATHSHNLIHTYTYTHTPTFYVLYIPIKPFACGSSIQTG